MNIPNELSLMILDEGDYREWRVKMTELVKEYSQCIGWTCGIIHLGDGASQSIVMSFGRRCSKLNSRIMMNYRDFAQKKDWFEDFEYFIASVNDYLIVKYKGNIYDIINNSILPTNY